jgi:glycosyltransferase involved in cell wall biosynthesis
MAVAAHAAIRKHCESVQIQWLVSKRSFHLKKELARVGLPYTELAGAQPFSLWRHPLRALVTTCRTAAHLRQLSPRLVVVVQGGILLSFCGIISAYIAGIQCCSYIPMAHRISETKTYRLRNAADFIWVLLYRTISSYITIDVEQAARLRKENPAASVMVVENFIPRNEPLTIDTDAKNALGVPPGRKLLTVIGRIEFAQKCQDWIVRELRNDPFLDDKFVLFVGNGSDAKALRTMLGREMDDRFSMVGWKNDLREVYAATDVLLIPSKIEGVPLVMLEALGYQIPVVGTDRDGMRNWLPQQWLFTWGDLKGLKKGIADSLAGTSPEIWANIAGRLRRIHDEGRFAADFSHALVHYSNRSGTAHDGAKIAYRKEARF